MMTVTSKVRTLKTRQAINSRMSMKIPLEMSSQQALSQNLPLQNGYINSRQKMMHADSCWLHVTWQLYRKRIMVGSTAINKCFSKSQLIVLQPVLFTNLLFSKSVRPSVKNIQNHTNHTKLSDTKPSDTKPNDTSLQIFTRQPMRSNQKRDQEETQGLYVKKKVWLINNRKVIFSAISVREIY